MLSTRVVSLFSAISLSSRVAIQSDVRLRSLPFEETTFRYTGLPSNKFAHCKADINEYEPVSTEFAGDDVIMAKNTSETIKDRYRSIG